MNPLYLSHLINQNTSNEAATNILALIILTSLWCNGITFFAEDGEPLSGVRRLVEKLPQLIAKPLLSCISCMASIHTIFVMLLYGWAFNCLSWEYMRQYFLVAVCSVVMNGILFLVRKNLEHFFFSSMNQNKFEKIKQEEDIRIFKEQYEHIYGIGAVPDQQSDTLIHKSEILNEE